MEGCEQAACWRRVRQRDGVAGEFLCGPHFTALVTDCPKEARCYAPLDVA